MTFSSTPGNMPSPQPTPDLSTPHGTFYWSVLIFSAILSRNIMEDVGASIKKLYGQFYMDRLALTYLACKVLMDLCEYYPDLPEHLKDQIANLVKSLTKFAKSQDEAEKFPPPCPDLSRDVEGQRYLSLREVGKLVIGKIFPNAKGIFTQDALVQVIGPIVAKAIRAQPGREPIERVIIRKFDGSTFVANQYYVRDYPIIFKTIHDWMMTWKDNSTDVEKYVAFL